MPKIVNRSPRMVTFPIMVKVKDRETGKDKMQVAKRIIMPPLQLTTVSGEEWTKIKKTYLAKKMLDGGELIDGEEAVKESIDPDVIRDELSKDLTPEELTTLEVATG